MNAINFLYWLQGSLELAKTKSFSSEQIQIIKEHISLVSEIHPFVLWLKGFLDGKNKIKGDSFDKLLSELNSYILKESNKNNLLDIKLEPTFPPNSTPWIKRNNNFDPFKIIC